MQNLVVEDIEHEMRGDSVSCPFQLQLQYAMPALFEPLAGSHALDDEEHAQQQNQQHHRQGDRAGLVQLCRLVLKHQVVVQFQRILGKAVHDFRSSHVDSVVLQRIILLHIPAQILECHAVIALGKVISLQILIADLAQVEGYEIVDILAELLLLAVQNAGNGRHISLLHLLTDMNRITVIYRLSIVVGHHERLALGKIFLRLGNAVQIEIHICHIQLAEIHVEAVALLVLLQQLLQLQEFAERLGIVFLIIVVVAVIVQVIRLHSQRHLREMVFRLLIALERCIKIIEFQVDGSQTHIEGDILLLGQLEGIYQKERTAIPGGSLRQLILEEIGITQIGTDARCLMLHIATHGIGIGRLVERNHLVCLAMKIMIVDALAVVGIGKKSVAARSIGLTEGETQGAVHIAYRRIGRCRLAEPSSLPGIILIKREAVFRQLHTFFYFRLSLRRLRIEEFIELMQFFDTQVISSFLCRFPAGSQENQQRQERQENLPEVKLIIFHHFCYFLQGGSVISHSQYALKGQKLHTPHALKGQKLLAQGNTLG